MLGFFLRFFKLTEIPCGLFPDQALNGFDAISFSKGIISPIYEGQKEGLFIYLIAISQWIFGLGTWQIFGVSALIGVLTIGVTYFLAKELFNKNIALLTAFFLATSTWHITLSRTGFRAILVPLVIALFFFFLLKIFRAEKQKRKQWYAILAGAVFGLGFYTYTAYRVFPLVLILMAGFLFWKKKQFFLAGIKKFKEEVIISGLTALLFILPLLCFFIIFPETFFNRVSAVSIFNGSDSIGGAMMDIWINFLRTIKGFFFFLGDINWRHNTGAKPLVSALVSPFLYLGLGYCFIRAGRFFLAKKTRIEDLKYGFLLVWFLMMMLPAVLTNEGVPPHGLRLIGTLPVVLMIPALIIDKVFGWTKKTFQDAEISLKIGKFIMLVFLVGVGWMGYKHYFGMAPSSPIHYENYRCDLPKLTAFITENPEARLIIDDFSVISIQYFLYPQEINYITPEKFWDEISEAEMDAILSENTVYVVANSYGDSDEKIKNKLRGKYNSKVFRNKFEEPDFEVFRGFHEVIN